VTAEFAFASKHETDDEGEDDAKGEVDLAV
jgi:hypothetical protein